MSGIQTHIDSPVTEIRQCGMVVGERLMNWLNHKDCGDGDGDGDGTHMLTFEYEPSASVEELQRLARFVSAG